MRFTKIFSLLILLLACSYFTVPAQNSGAVKGKLRAENGGGIAGATVTARQEGEDVKTVKSDAKGNFQLSGLKPGLYNFTFEKNGYATGVKYNVEVKKNK
jgi:hypothetical protein